MLGLSSQHSAGVYSVPGLSSQHDAGSALQGYGPTQAFLPASISLEGAPNISNYVSDGNSKLPMLIHVQDQAGTDITSGNF